MRKTTRNTYGTRVLAKGVEVSNDSHKTFLNGNDAVLGSSGSGKTTTYVMGNLTKLSGSYIIADTKGNLARKFGSKLRKAGYDVKVIDFVNLEKSVGYNPMDYIRRYDGGGYSEQDVIKLAALLSPITDKDDPYWQESARNLICAFIALALETEEPEDQNLATVGKYAAELGFLTWDKNKNPINNSMRHLHERFEDAHKRNPRSLAWRKYNYYSDIQQSERTWACIINYTQKVMSSFDISAFDLMFTNEDKIDLAKPGKEKCAYFVNVSDSDRSLDTISNIFYTQLFQVLMSEADNNKNSRLDVPVRIILDDFATNVYIPDFDKLISVIRSRDISVSLILQSLTQLDSLYGEYAARTILCSCDHILYLGGHDLETCKYISQLANAPLEYVIDMPLDRMYILTRGQKAVYAERMPPDTMDIDEELPEMTCAKSVVMSNVPSSLVFSCQNDNKSYFKVTFAYSLGDSKPIYAVFKVPDDRVNTDGDKCSIDLGTPETNYICNLSDSYHNINLSAKAIETIFRRNRNRYITYIKKRDKTINA